MPEKPTPPEVTQDDLEDVIIAYYTYIYGVERSLWREPQLQHMKDVLAYLKTLRDQGGTITVQPKKKIEVKNEATAHHNV